MLKGYDTEYECEISVQCFEVLDGFSIFNLEKGSTDYSSHEFTVYYNTEVETLFEHYFGTDHEREIILLMSGTVLNLN